MQDGGFHLVMAEPEGAEDEKKPSSQVLCPFPAGRHSVAQYQQMARTRFTQ